MNLKVKKKLIARTLGIGIERVYLNPDMLTEVKEAITRQDIRDLIKEKVIQIKEKKGVKKNVKRKTRKGAGSIKKTVGKRKRKYITLIRNLRRQIKSLKDRGILKTEEYYGLRKKVKNREIKDAVHLRESVKNRGVKK